MGDFRAMSLTLQVKLLGEWSITYNDRVILGLNSTRSQALLAYLILHRHAPQPRQRLAFHLWVDSTETQARTNLRKELSYLRRNLPEADRFLLVEFKTLQWFPAAPFGADVVEFENALIAAEAADGETAQSWLKQAIALYKGDLLPDCEDEWIIPQRERLQQLYVGALTQLTEQLEAQQDYRVALHYAQQLFRADSLNEATYCTLMRLHSGSGDRANALQVYHRCMTVLRNEFGVNPSLATRNLYEQLLREEERAVAKAPADLVNVRSLVSLRPTHLNSSILPLIGRKREWSLICEWAVAESHEASQVLLLVGEPGIGKTRILEELREAVPVTLWGRAFAAELVRPYGIWIDALRSLELPSTIKPSATLGYLLPEMGQPMNAPPDRSHLFDAVVQLLVEWADQQPLVVMLDDIQWVDEASSALLHYAIRLLSHLPVRFACTARPGELETNAAASQVVQALRRERRLQTLELHSFDRKQTAELLRTAAGDSAALSIERIDRVFVDSGGNPLFVLELARAFNQNQVAHADDLEALIGDRLQCLEPTARDLLPWAAALGHRFNPATLAQVSDYDLPQMLTAIEQLEQQTIIHPSGAADAAQYDFVHDIVRQTVYRQLSEPRRQLVHLQIAHKLNQRLAADAALVGEVAHHAALGSDHDLATTASLSAAERCLKLFAYTEAAELAHRGIQHSQWLDTSTRIRLHLQLLRVAGLAGVTGDRATQLEIEVNQLMDEARRLGLKDEEAIGLETIATLYFNQNDFAGMHPHLLRSVEVSRAASPVAAVRLLALSGSCLIAIGRDMVRAEALLLEAQSLAARVGLELCDIEGGLGGIHAHKGDYAEARTLLHQAWQQAQAEQDHWRSCTFLTDLAIIELEVGDPLSALPYCNEMMIVAAKIQGEGSEGAIATALAALANYRLKQPDADADLERAIVTLQQVDAKRMLSYVLSGAAETDLERDHLRLAVSRAEMALQAAQLINHPSEMTLAWALLVQGWLAIGDRTQAKQTFESWPDATTTRHTLSFRAQTALGQALQMMQKNHSS